MTHEDARDAMALFVVDADDPAARAALLRHLEGCEACRRELALVQQAATALAFDVPQIRPRPGLRARILTAALPAPPATPGLTPPLVAHEPAAAPPRANRWTGWLAAAAALIAAVATVGLLQTRAEIDVLRATLADWQTRVDEAERAARASQATLVTYRRQLDVITADDVLLVSLDGLPPADRAQGRAYVSRSLNAILFTARDLPPLPADRVYQLWAVAGGQAISAGVFVPDPRGRGQVVAEVPALTTRPDALAVTVEPEGGVPAPTGPKYLLGVPAN